MKQSFWLSSKMSLLLHAKEQDSCILICGCDNAAFSERCMLAQLLDVNRQGMTLRLPLDKKPVLPESGDIFLSFTVEEGETACHEIRARSHLLTIRQYDKTLLMCLTLPHEFVSRQVRRHERLPAHKLRLLSCGMTPLNYLPRNAPQLRYAVAASLPEVLMLKQVMRWKLLAVFLGMLLVLFTLVGWLFNGIQAQHII